MLLCFAIQRNTRRLERDPEILTVCGLKNTAGGGSRGFIIIKQGMVRYRPGWHIPDPKDKGLWDQNQTADSG